jgi:hypothetical protein
VLAKGWTVAEVRVRGGKKKQLGLWRQIASWKPIRAYRDLQPSEFERNGEGGRGGQNLHSEFARAAAVVGFSGDLGRAEAALATLEGTNQGQLPQPAHQLRVRNKASQG